MGRWFKTLGVVLLVVVIFIGCQYNRSSSWAGNITMDFLKHLRLSDDVSISLKDGYVIFNVGDNQQIVYDAFSDGNNIVVAGYRTIVWIHNDSTQVISTNFAVNKVFIYRNQLYAGNIEGALYRWRNHKWTLVDNVRLPDINKAKVYDNEVILYGGRGGVYIFSEEGLKEIGKFDHVNGVVVSDVFYVMAGLNSPVLYRVDKNGNGFSVVKKFDDATWTVLDGFYDSSRHIVVFLLEKFVDNQYVVYAYIPNTDSLMKLDSFQKDLTSGIFLEFKDQKYWLSYRGIYQIKMEP